MVFPDSPIDKHFWALRPTTLSVLSGYQDLASLVSLRVVQESQQSFTIWSSIFPIAITYLDLVALQIPYDFKIKTLSISIDSRLVVFQIG